METPADTAAKQLAWHLETQTSVEIEVTTKIIPLGESASPSPVFTSTVEHYIETASGQRFLDFRGIKAGAVVVRSAHYGDGKDFTDVNYQNANVDIQQSVYKTNHFFMEESSDRRQVPPPLLYLYVGRKPLQKALTDAEYLGTGECLGRECELFLFKQVRWQIPLDQVFSLDKKTSIPLKVENYRDESSREKKQPMTTWAAKSLDSAQGRSIPLESTVSQYGKDGSPIFRWDFSVNKIKYDGSFPDSTFRPVLQPGVLVLDGIANKSYKTPGAATAPPVVQPGVSAAGQDIQATPPVDWTAAAATGILLLGVALVIVGVFAWWRRR